VALVLVVDGRNVNGSVRCQCWAELGRHRVATGAVCASRPWRLLDQAGESVTAIRGDRLNGRIKSCSMDMLEVVRAAIARTLAWQFGLA
jgi:hypothetical protein